MNITKRRDLEVFNFVVVMYYAPHRFISDLLYIFSKGKKHLIDLINKNLFNEIDEFTINLNGYLIL